MNVAYFIYDKLTYAYALIVIISMLFVAELVKYKRQPYKHLDAQYNFGTPLGDSPYMFTESEQTKAS